MSKQTKNNNNNMENNKAMLQEMFNVIKLILEKEEVTSIPKQDSAKRLQTIFKFLEPVNIDPIEAINYLAEYFSFSTLTSEISLNPLVIKISEFFNNVHHFSHYASDDVTSKIGSPRLLKIDGNRLKISFTHISKKGYRDSKLINFGRFCNNIGTKYTSEQFKLLASQKSFNIEDNYIQFNLNYHFKDFIKKVAMLLLSGASGYNEVDLTRFFTFDEYLNTSETQFDRVTIREVEVLRNLREYIYNLAIHKGIDIAHSFATYNNRNILESKADLDIVNNQNYGGIFLTQEFLLREGLYSVLIKSLTEREIALLNELITQTVTNEYRVKHLGMSANNFSISGLSSTSNVTELAYKLEDQDIITNLENKITNFFLEKAKEREGRINILLDSTIVFCDGKTIIANKDTYAKGQGFGRAIKAVLLLTDDGFPLIFNVVKGNEPDVTSLSDLVNKLELNHNIPKELITFVCDAGYFSKDNIMFLINRHYDVNIVGKSINLSKSLIEKIDFDEKLDADDSADVESYIEKEIPLSKYITSRDVQAYNKKYPDDQMDSTLIHNRKLKVVVIYNLDIYGTEFKDYRNKIIQLKKDIKSSNKETVKKALRHSFITKHKLYKVETLENGSYVLIKNKQAMLKLGSRLGCNTIFSTLNHLDCGQIVNIYHSRINIELQFKVCKQYLGFNAVRVHSDATLALKTLVTQISIGMLNKINNTIFTPKNNSYINDDDKNKLIGEFRNARNLINFIHQDLNFTTNNELVIYNKMNKLTRIALNSLQFQDPIQTKFIHSTYSYNN